MDPRDENDAIADETTEIWRPASYTHRLPESAVGKQRQYLAGLARADLVLLYESMIGRFGSRTRLSDAVLIDLIIWLEAYPRDGGYRKRRRRA